MRFGIYGVTKICCSMGFWSQKGQDLLQTKKRNVIDTDRYVHIYNYIYNHVYIYIYPLLKQTFLSCILCICMYKILYMYMIFPDGRN